MPDKKKILVIDDDTRNIFALCAVLKAKGYEYRTSLSAQAGIALLMAETDIGLVLLDMMMPEMDGYAALQQIRDTPLIASVPVIAVTAQAMQGDKIKCLEAGANEYISKPIDTPTLLNYLKRYLG